MASWDSPTTFAQLWADRVETRPDAAFLIFEGPDGSVDHWTYAEFDLHVHQAASLLASWGVVAGSSVHLALTNSPTFVAVWIATNRLGGWIISSDPMSRAPELQDHIERTNPTVGFCSRDRSETYRQAAPEHMLVLEIDEADTSFDAFPRTDRAWWAQPRATDRAAVNFTSGTTGRPKGVEITQANYAFTGMTMANAAGLTSADRNLVVLPLFHANAQHYSIASAIWAGASVALMHTFSASGFLPQVKRHEATCASLFAAPMRMILARGGPVDGASLRHCWFAQNLAADQYETLSSWFGCRPRQLYGMTETIPAVLTEEVAEPHADAMGFVTPGCEVDIHDANGSPVVPGEVGEIVVRGDRGITIFAGYLDAPDTTAASFRDGWFLTGDRATRDVSGRYRFDGRRSDILKVAGENVSTVEVESVLTAHPGVLEAAVVGVPDALRDEVPVAFIVASDTALPPTTDELQEWCAGHLSKAKLPRQITFLDELPRTSVGKIRKFMLQKG
jgi:carnitine-CoA ligase